MATLEQLRESLAHLKSYQLPERFETAATASQQDLDVSERPSTKPILEPQTVERYRKARESYLRCSIMERFLEHVATIQYDENTEYPTAQLPPSVSQEAEVELRELKEQVKEDLRQCISKVRTSHDGVLSKYQLLCQKRDHLEKSIEEAENQKGDEEETDPGIDMAIENDTIELSKEEENHKILLLKRKELESKLRKIRADKEDLNSAINRKKAVLEDLTNKNKGFEGKQLLGAPCHGNIDSMTITEIHEATAAISRKAEELRDRAEWYDSMKGTMEELGGMKILSVTSIDPNSSESNNDDDKDESASLSKITEAITLNVRLLDEYVVKIVLSSIDNAAVDVFRVKSAHFITPTTIHNTIEDPKLRDSNPTPTITFPLPSLDDLVSLSADLGPMHDLRFVLREAMARVRTLSARVDELAQLRMKYLTKITNPNHNSRLNTGFGRDDQEIVCSLSTGVTVVLCLTVDCPMVDGSAYIQQIVGVAGWQEEHLHDIKDAINDKRCRSPLHCMDLLVQEINRVEKEEGLVIPKTPVLPKKG